MPCPCNRHQRRGGEGVIWMDKQEMAKFTGIWLGFLCMVIGLWVYDHLYNDDQLIAYGVDASCIVTRGRLNFLIIPARVVCLFNACSTIFSLIQYKSLVEAEVDTGKKLVIAVGRLIVFQSTQWIFGIIYYFTSNEIMRYIFEISVTYEGVLIAFSMYFRYFSAFCKDKRIGEA